MFDSYYRFSHRTSYSKVDGGLLKVHVFAFFGKGNHRYIVDVEEYKNAFFAVKFYLKAHKNSKNKFSLMTGFGDEKRILGTCVQIMLVIQKRNPMASFGFVAANIINESDNCNKRFRVYKEIMRAFFSPVHFDHYTFETKSIYALLNKDFAISHPSLVEDVESMFTTLFDVEK